MSFLEFNFISIQKRLQIPDIINRASQRFNLRHPFTAKRRRQSVPQRLVRLIHHSDPVPFSFVPTLVRIIG